MKQFLTLFIFMVGALALTNTVQARPVSYPGGVTVITTNDSNANAVLTHYSPTARHSIGYRLEHLRDQDITINALQSNILMKRWNGPDSQANLYFKTGLGIAHSDYGRFENETDLAGFAGFAVDWEDRRFFVSYENRGLKAGDMAQSFSQKARLGIAPYVAEYGGLHTWLMVEFQHYPRREDEFRVVPLVRLFKGVGMVEAGIDSQGDPLFNFIYRF